MRRAGRLEIAIDAMTPGAVFRGPYPFVRDKYTDFNGDGFSEIQTWKPGAVFQNTHGGDSECIANGVGEIILTVVSTHKPAHFPTRVFFTRRWRGPDGKEFGKPRCLCVTLEKFRRLAKSYQFEFVVEAAKAA